MRLNPTVLAASLLGAALLAAPAAARDVVGSGKIVEQARNVGAFTRVQVASGIQVQIASGAPSPITLRGEDNILAVLRTEVRDGSLRIDFQPDTSITSQKGVSVGIRMPSIEGLAASGGSLIEASAPAGDVLDLAASGGAKVKMGPSLKVRELRINGSGGSEIAASGVEAQVVRVEGSGATQVTLAGKADSAVVNASGATQVHAESLAVDGLEVHASGGCHVAMRAAGVVKGSISGGTRVRVPPSARVEVDSSGGSDVRGDVK